MTPGATLVRAVVSSPAASPVDPLDQEVARRELAPSGPPAAGLAANRPPPAVEASPTPDPSPEAATVAAPPARQCAGCGLPLDSRRKGDARRHHNARCRQAAYRTRRRAEVLTALDVIAAEVARLRSEVERW